jgi:hypothetical protein
MNSYNLQDALNQSAAGHVPELPTNFEQNVWREIRSRKMGRESIWDAFIATCLRPTWAIAASAVVLFVSASFGAMEVDVQQNAAHTALNLGVFSAEAPTLPSTLLTHSR